MSAGNLIRVDRDHYLDPDAVVSVHVTWPVSGRREVVIGLENGQKHAIVVARGYADTSAAELDAAAARWIAQNLAPHLASESGEARDV